MKSGVQHPSVPLQVAPVCGAAVAVLVKAVLALADSTAAAAAVTQLPFDFAKVAASPDMLAASVVGLLNALSTSSAGTAQLKAPCYAGVVPSVEHVVLPPVEQVVLPPVEQIVLPPVGQVVQPSVEQIVLPPVEQVVMPSVEQVVLPSVEQVTRLLPELAAAVVPLV